MRLAVKFTMAMIKLTTLSSRISYIFDYVGKLGPMEALPETIAKMLKTRTLSALAILSGRILRFLPCSKA